MTPDDEDDNRQPEHVGDAAKRTLGEIVKRNLAQREQARAPKPVPQKPVLRPRPYPVLVVVPKGPPPVIVQVRCARELPFPAAMFHHNGLVFVSHDLKVWRATVNYPRLVERLKNDSSMALFKSLTVPAHVPRGMTMVSEAGLVESLKPPPAPAVETP